MILKQLFDVFSRRPRHTQAEDKPLSDTFRNRVVMICRDRFGLPNPGLSGNPIGTEFWTEIYTKLCYLHGSPTLKSVTRNFMDDAFDFLMSCSDEHFLDFVEYIFQPACYQRVFPDEDELVEEINRFLLVDDLPFAVTRFVWENRTKTRYGRPVEVRIRVAYPKVICRSDQLLHSTAIEPALHLLSDKDFVFANTELLGGLEDFRKGDYGDCMTKCGSALESTMKVICTKKGWQIPSRPTANQFLQAIFSNSGLEGFLKDPLLIVATMRNRFSTAHGAGVQQRLATKSRAKYTINATASAIVFLVEELL